MSHDPAIRPTNHERRTPLFELALTGSLTEEDLTPKADWYPKQKRKEKAILRDSKVNEQKPKYPDELWGYLNPILVKLNNGKPILSGSQEHKSLKQLLEKASNC